MKQILAVGEILFDVIDGTYKLGGAPFNVAAHMAKLGHHSYILSSVGMDEPGDRILREVKELNVSTDLIHRNGEKATGTVMVTFEDGEPQYDIVRDVAWDYLESDFHRAGNHTWEVVVFGSLAQRSAHNQSFFHRFFREINVRWKYFDCNLRQDYFNREILESSMQFANICKFNKDEISVSSRLLYDSDMNPEEFGTRIQEDFNLEMVIFTMGKEGSMARYQGRLYQKPVEVVRVEDTIGAGDAFNAGFLHAWINDLPVEKALEFGNRLGSFVASRSGAIPEYPPQLRSYFQV